MPQARIRSYIYREKTPIVAYVHHEGLRSYAAWSSKLNVTVDVTTFLKKKSHANHSVKQLSKFAKLVCLYKRIYKRAFFQVVV